jgi:hypothetical protein
MNLEMIDRLLKKPEALKEHIIRRLDSRNNPQSIYNLKDADWRSVSAVLFLLGRYPHRGRFFGRPCLILNKRSAKVRQAGDLCCPGGRISRRLDSGLAALLRLPMSPLVRWPLWKRCQREQPRQAEWLRLLLATGLRESIEEMRLSPLGLYFLGPLTAQSLAMFNRVIYPMVVWVSGQRRFYPNWEVEDIIHIPLQRLLDGASYARYRLQIETRSDDHPQINTFPCFRHTHNNRLEILWGATYRITIGFLKLAFDFVPPDMQSLPEIRGRLSRSYLLNNLK